jgi:hypothetical protein
LASTHGPATLGPADPVRQAFRILQLGFVVAPILAGLDKLFNGVVDWEVYLAPVIRDSAPFGARTLMIIIGVVEIAAGLLVAVRPRIGAYVVAGWLVAIIVNLLIVGDFYDIALRDLGLALGALALARLARVVSPAGTEVPLSSTT